MDKRHENRRREQSLLPIVLALLSLNKPRLSCLILFSG